MKKEIWLAVPGYEGLYWVSNLGRVKSLYKRIREQILKPGKVNGYLQVQLFKEGKRRFFLVHRIVWEAFKGPIPEGMEINHLNECTWDNRLENLSLATPKENSNWGTRNRRIAKSRSKMVEQYTLDGKHIMTWFSVTGIQEEFGWRQGNISSCCNGKRKTSHGYIWKYKE